MGVIEVLRFVREAQVVKLRQSAGLSDQQATKIRSKFALRVDHGKKIDPTEFERFMYDMFPTARMSQVERERVKTTIKQHTKDDCIDLADTFWIVRLCGD